MRLVWSVSLALGLGACFESGPLATRAGSLDDEDADATLVPSDDTLTSSEPTDASAPPDTVPDGADTSATLVDSTDAADTIDTSVTDVAPDVEVRACLTHADCDDIPQLDRCAGDVRCIDYGCRQDPSTAVHCQEREGGDACIDLVCNPANGICEEVELCSCTPALTLDCGGRLDFTTSDPAAIEHFSSYTCGPPAGPWVEQIIGFSPPAGRVRLDLQSAGTTGMHVLELDGDRCSAEDCVAGGVERVYFDAAARPYVVVLDYAAAQSLVALTATCGITSETECADGLDDDGDQRIDCAEPECNGQDGCPLVLTSETGHCNDGQDDDDDELTDCDDSDCFDDAACLESCLFFTSPVVGCGFHQGSTTGGGTANATHYSCSPTPAPGKETVYRFRPSFTGSVDVAFSSVNGIALYLLEDRGQGCTPRHCLEWGPTGFSFWALEGVTYYFAIDTAAGVTGNYDLRVTCD